MVETLDEFYDRIWVNFCTWPADPKVFVYESAWQKERSDRFKPDIWTKQTALNYLNWLEKQQ